MFCMVTVKYHFCTFQIQFKSLKRGKDWFLLARDFFLVQISVTNFHRIRFHSTNLCFRRSTRLDFSAFSTPFFVHHKGNRIVSLAYLILEWISVVCQLRNSSIQCMWRMTTQSRMVQSLVRRMPNQWLNVGDFFPFSCFFFVCVCLLKVYACFEKHARDNKRKKELYSKQGNFLS